MLCNFINQINVYLTVQQLNYPRNGILFKIFGQEKTRRRLNWFQSIDDYFILVQIASAFILEF